MPRLRVSISIAIGLTAGILCWSFLKRFNQGAGDFNWAIWAARDLVVGRNPYQHVLQLYPLIAALVGFPLAWLPGPAAGGIFYGLSSAVLAFGLTRNGYRRLWVFLAYPFWAGLMCAQWPPLIMAAAFYPHLQWVGLAKPQLGIPIFVRCTNRLAVSITVATLVASFVLFPSWPLAWFRSIGGYQHFYPLLVLPGVMLLLALPRFRDRDVRLLLIMAAMPQRWFYDAFILWLIPKSRRELAWTVFLSWVPALWRWHYVPKSFIEVGRWAVVFFYIPMMIVILLRPKAEKCQDLL